MDMARARVDAHLASRVRDALAEDPRLNVLDVEVRFAGGALHLHGELASEELIEIAQDIARELLPDDVAVVNRLTVCHPARNPDHERIR